MLESPNILVAGAGAIGSEFMKLFLTLGFGRNGTIHLVDDDYL